MKRASKWILRITLAILVIMAALIGLWQLSKMRSYQLFGEIVSSVDTHEKVIALTFDDGPTAAYTNEILAILDQYGVKATFFVIGREVEENPEYARSIVEAGHELGNHSWSHPNMSLLSLDRIADEIERTDAAIRAVGYEGELHFRPPFGKKLLTLPWYLRQHNRTTVMWDIEPETYTEIAAEPSRIVQHVLDKARPGSIVLLHLMYESRETSRQALPTIIERLHEQGYKLVTVSELLSVSAFAAGDR